MITTANHIYLLKLVCKKKNEMEAQNPLHTGPWNSWDRHIQTSCVDTYVAKHLGSSRHKKYIHVYIVN